MPAKGWRSPKYEGLEEDCKTMTLADLVRKYKVHLATMQGLLKTRGLVAMERTPPPPPPERACTGCRQMFPLSEFPKRKRSLYGKNPKCRTCYNEYQKQYAEEIAKETQERYAEVQRNWYLKRTYGISVAGYNLLLEAQNHGCAICGGPPGKRRFHVDHDHKSGAVRGLLCTTCNIGLGNFHDNPEKLEQAARYVRYWSS